MKSNSRYQIHESSKYIRKVEKLIKGNKSLEKRINIVMDKLSLDPHHRALRSHLINDSVLGIVWSSRVSKDLRIVWKLVDRKLIILLLDIGGHSGKRSVYK